MVVAGCDHDDRSGSVDDQDRNAEPTDLPSEELAIG
jgi:hypothetical protein